MIDFWFFVWCLTVLPFGWVTASWLLERRERAERDAECSTLRARIMELTR